MGKYSPTQLGDRLGSLVAVCPTGERYGGSAVWKWQCDCGGERLGAATILRNQLRQRGHLGCPRCRSATHPGDRLGSLVAVCPTGERYGGSIVWKWQCDCGGVLLGVGAHLRKQLLRGGRPGCPCCRLGSATHLGDRLGSLVAVCPTGERYGGSIVWKWQCDCGGTLLGVGAHLRKQLQHAGRLGCSNCQPEGSLLGLPTVDLTGRKFGRWTVLRRVDKPGTRCNPLWLCRCECGRKAEVRRLHLIRGNSQECPVCGKANRIRGDGGGKANGIRGDGERLRHARKRAGLTLAEASALVGFSRQRWQQYEMTNRIRPTRLAELLAAIKEAKS